MTSNWSKGFTKETHPSIRKRAATMKALHINNFQDWMDRMKKEGRIKSIYPEFEKNGDLAELMGVVLGDGHIRKFPRTEELSIFSNANNPGFVKRYADLIEKIFAKKPAITFHGDKNCIRIRIYEKQIQPRLGVPYSPRGKLKIKVPNWIFENKDYIVRYLRGLYEAEGCFSQHPPTSTYKLFFSNRNNSMLENVFRLVKKLGFNPHMSKKNYSVQLSRKEEVFEAIKLLEFRKY